MKFKPVVCHGCREQIAWYESGPVKNEYPKPATAIYCIDCKKELKFNT